MVQQPQVTSRGSRHSEAVTPSIAGVVTNTLLMCFVIAPLASEDISFELGKETFSKHEINAMFMYWGGPSGIGGVGGQNDQHPRK